MVYTGTRGLEVKVKARIFGFVSRAHPLDHRKSKRVPEKHLFLLY